MVKVKFKKFARERSGAEALPWEEDTRKIAADAIRARMAKPKRLRTRLKLRLAKKAKILEDQFDIPPGPRASKWWDLFKDGINNSGLQLWLTDRHQFYLRYVCGYEFKVYSEPLEFGNVFHWLIEKWLRRELDPKDAEDALRSGYHSNWFEEWGGGLSPKNKDAQESFYCIAGAMFPHYASRYADDRAEKPLGIEVEFRAPHKLASGEKIELYGTIDLIKRNRADKSIEVIDHKTSSWINENEIQAALTLNFQLMLYAYAWRQLRKKDEDAFATRITHDVIRRTVLKKKQNETFGSFGRRIGREVKARPDFFFNRFYAECTPEKHRAYLRYVFAPMLEDFAAWARGDAPHYPNPNALIGRYGPCKLFGPITQGSFVGVPRKRPTTRGIEI